MPQVPDDLIYTGPNEDDVREVIEFAFSARILSSKGKDEELPELLAITEMARAVDIAGGVGAGGSWPVAYGSDGIVAPEQWPYEGDVDWSEEGWYMIKQHMVGAYRRHDLDRWWGWEKQHAFSLRVCQSLAVKWKADSPEHLREYLSDILPKGPNGPRNKRAYFRDYIANEVASDMMNCAIQRAYQGTKESFWEKIFRIYRAGLWPCGWKGKWPTPGKFIAWRRYE